MSVIGFGFGIAAFVMSLCIMFLLMPLKAFNDEVGVCVSTSPQVVVTSPMLSPTTGLPVCKMGTFVKAVAK